MTLLDRLEFYRLARQWHEATAAGELSRCAVILAAIDRALDRHLRGVR